MLRQDLVEGYVRGDITRRTFVRRLTVTGVSLAAALSYAELLQPQAAQAFPGETDLYEDGTFPQRERTLPPDVITESPAAIADTGATARAQIDPNWQDTEVWFEVQAPDGAVTATPKVLVTGDEDRRVEIALTGLAQQTTYVVRAVAENGSGRTAGEPFAFATAATPPKVEPAAVAASAVPVVAAPPADTRGPFVDPVRVRTTLRQVLAKGTLPVTVTSDEDATADFVATLRTPVRGVRAALSRTRKVTVTTGRATLRAGRPATVKLRLSRAGRRALKGRTSATLTLEIRAVDRARNRTLLRTAVKLK